MEKFRGYTGKIAESEVLGETAKPEYEKKMAMEGYITYDQAMDLVKDFQPFQDPTDPYENRFPQDVHATLADLLKLQNFSQLRYYTAIDSPLDRLHSVDAFFELDLGNGQCMRVTLDMTQNPNKEDYKADVVFQWPREGLSYEDPDDKSFWKDKVQEIAYQLFEVFGQKIDLTNLRSLTKEELETSKQISEQQRQKRLLRSLNLRKRRLAHAS